ncbi:MAG: AAA family ATPase [Candidatus Gastranaerophilales bacterium]|nr:AAA family ATPase [Candidatus Gastranaerophilales bacterium]
MKKVFVKTQNVKNLINMMNNLQNRAEGVPGFGLVYGEPGLGKTQAILWWVMQNDAVFIRSTKLMTGRWLLEELIEELGEYPGNKNSDLFKQCVNQLKETPRTIVIDEVDYLTGESQVIETLRDVHDKTGVPIILVGMAMADKKLIRYRHLYDRISEKLKFEEFRKEDIKDIVNQLSEVKMTECAIDYIYNNTSRFRQIVKLINKAEQIASANEINMIDEITLKEFVPYDSAEDYKAG